MRLQVYQQLLEEQTNAAELRNRMMEHLYDRWLMPPTAGLVPPRPNRFWGAR